MGIDVYFFVFWILVKVEASWVHNISVIKFKCHDIVSWLDKVLIRDLNALPIESDCTILNTIHFHIADRLPLEVDEKRDFRLGFLYLIQVKIDLIDAHIATF